MRPALLLLVLAAGCREQGPHGVVTPPADSPARPTPRRATLEGAPAPISGWADAGALRVSGEQAACADRWLSDHRLDAYGSPRGTMYTGGTPTFDERTGQTIDRWTVLARNRPEALRSCGVSLP